MSAVDICAALDVVYGHATAAGLWRAGADGDLSPADSVDHARTELSAAVAVLLAYPADEADSLPGGHHDTHQPL